MGDQQGVHRNRYVFCIRKYQEVPMSRVLIVEDEEAIADLEKDYLELSGFTVEIENNGTAGLKRALSEEFDMFNFRSYASGNGWI